MRRLDSEGSHTIKIKPTSDRRGEESVAAVIGEVYASSIARKQ